jgi:hypothetical protein
MTRFFAKTYAIIAALVTAFTWVTDVSIQNNPAEHMLPDTLLFFVTFPLSLSIAALYPLPPLFFGLRFAELLLFTLCAAVEAALFWWVAKNVSARNAG